MQNKQIKGVVIAGGGTAGWITAALLNKVLGKIVNITLIESEQIGTVGVGEASISPILHLNAALGIPESEFIKATQATIKLGIEFENWRAPQHSYMHAFGEIGKDLPFCEFYHYWLRAKQQGTNADFWDFSLNYQAAKQHKFAHLKHIPNTQLSGLNYAYHFDATLYGEFLKGLTISRGVKRIEGQIADVKQCPESGFVKALELLDGQIISGDLFIDCTGLSALLIEKTLNTGFENWTHWLPCDSAVAVQSESANEPVPYTRSIAQNAGWQWQIPLQHRVGNGLVFSSRYLTDDEAKQQLLANLPGKAITEPRVIRFKTGRRRLQWHKNVVAIGLSSGFLEPLESTSIHLIQTAAIRLIKLFPHNGIKHSQVTTYNLQSKTEIERIRDFIILHYKLTTRTDSAFGRQCQQMSNPETLQQKITLFKQTGKLTREDDELFSEPAWQQVMIGQGLEADDYHPLANALTDEPLLALFSDLKALINHTVEQLPSHSEFLSRMKNN
ncbi:tryptophan halogenase family protein [Pseudoalteromonas sp. 120-MNA-CIBAN-0494]|uniref:tryptophan halogenase family protein n=3 Tax=Pseudoalteromonas TaxID=53246 RepID=UPI003333CCD9|tara:strand:+ start:2803 stop:4302 length:1500 start_codon:yes stop_codon:yes gene_type:complete